VTLHIKNGLVVDTAAATTQVVDLFLMNGKIAGIGSAPAGFKVEQTIDAVDCWIMPGLIDCQARLRDPGEPEKANIESETEAAIKNGITTLCIPPDKRPTSKAKPKPQSKTALRRCAYPPIRSHQLTIRPRSN
jgi:dihydroorotase